MIHGFLCFISFLSFLFLSIYFLSFFSRLNISFSRNCIIRIVFVHANGTVQISLRKFVFWAANFKWWIFGFDGGFEVRCGRRERRRQKPPVHNPSRDMWLRFARGLERRIGKLFFSYNLPWISFRNLFTSKSTKQGKRKKSHTRNDPDKYLRNSAMPDFINDERRREE